MNTTELFAQVFDLEMAKVYLDPKTLAAAGKTDEPLYVMTTMRENDLIKDMNYLAGGDRVVQNFVYIEDEHLSNAKHTIEELGLEFYKYPYFKSSPRTPKMFNLGESKNVHLAAKILKIQRNRHTKEADVINHWLMMKIEGSYQMVLCFRDIRGE